MAMENNSYVFELAGRFLMNVCKIGLTLTVLCVLFFEDPSMKQAVLGVVASLACAALGLSFKNKGRAARTSHSAQIIKLRR